MDPATLDQFLALNRHLAALAAAGVPLELGPRTKDATATLERYNSTIALDVGQGRSLAAALAQNDKLPGTYRAAVVAALEGGDSTAALDALSGQSSAERQLLRSAWRSLVAPLIVFALAYVAFIYLCLFVSPTLEALYDQLRHQLGEQPSASVRLLAAARTWLPVWGPLLPLFVIICIWVWRRGEGGRQRHLILGMKKYLADTRHANFAGQLARLIERDIPLVDALPLAAGQSSDQRLAAAAATISDARRRDESIEPAQVSTVPPLLRWALISQLSSEQLPDNLRFAADTYRRSAVRRADRWRFTLPVVVGALLGGVIVLAFGLSVFTPMVSLLENLSRP
ncbi:MAG: type II secretion system F family protein [Bythopirellula sp.]